jgi:hypothetical protein
MTGPKITYAIHDPMPGVWEVRLQDVEDTRTFDWQQAKKPEHVPPTAVTVTVSALDVSASSSAQVAGSAAPASTAMEIDFTNRLAEIPVAAVSVPMGAARREDAQLRQFEQRV